jgi:hypothetical protein
MTSFKEECQMAKVQSMSVKDFMKGKEWDKKRTLNNVKIAGLASGIASVTSILPQVGHAQSLATPVFQPIMGGIIAGSTVGKITTAFMPLLQLLQDLAFPVTSIIITGACFLYMINMKDKATSLMINGIIGYFLIQLCPIFMKILAEIAKAM